MRYAIACPRVVRTVNGTETVARVASYVDDCGKRQRLTFPTFQDAKDALFLTGDVDAESLSVRTKARLSVVSVSTVIAGARIIDRANGTYRAPVVPSDVKASHPNAVALAAAIDARLAR